MNMKKNITFSLTLLWILATRVYDAYCTFQYTPDLTHEANPLVSLFSLSWTPLLIIISILFMYTIYAYYLSFFKHFNFYPTEKDYSFSNFIGYIYLGKKQSWISILYKFPKDINRFHHYMGNLMSRCLVFVGVVTTFMWLLINYVPYYKNIHSATIIYVIVIIGSVFICYNWFLKLYKDYTL